MVFHSVMKENDAFRSGDDLLLVLLLVLCRGLDIKNIISGRQEIWFVED